MTGHLAELLEVLGGPAFVVKVFPDEWAYLIASSPGSGPIVLVLTPEAVRAEVGPLEHP